MTWIDKIRLGFVPGKVRTLYTLLLLERWGAERYIKDDAVYGTARAASYRFALLVMEDRWPVLGRLGRYVEQTRSG